MVKKMKNLQFSCTEWQLAEKDLDNFQKTIEIELDIKLKRRVYHFVILFSHHSTPLEWGQWTLWKWLKFGLLIAVYNY